MTDIVRRAYRTDMPLIVGGTVRSNHKYGSDDRTLRDLFLMLPFEDPCVVLSMTGAQVRRALENGVSPSPKWTDAGRTSVACAACWTCKAAGSAPRRGLDRQRRQPPGRQEADRLYSLASPRSPLGAHLFSRHTPA